MLSDSEAFRFNRRLQPWGTNPRCSHHLELKVIFVVHGAPRSEGLVSLELPSFSRIGLMVSHMGCPGRGVDQVGGLWWLRLPLSHISSGPGRKITLTAHPPTALCRGGCLILKSGKLRLRDVQSLVFPFHPLLRSFVA